MTSKKYNFIVLAAMPEEIGNFVKKLNKLQMHKFGDLDVFQGTYINEPNIQLTIAWSGWGKVSAARAVSRLIGIAEQKNNTVDLIIFTGVAGAADPRLSQWDIVISEDLVQHDMDASPLFKKFVIPSLGKEKILCNELIYHWAKDSINLTKNKDKIGEFGKVFSGLIATGDRFISDKETLKSIKDQLPNLLAVEMEGASVAQVATQEGIPWLVLRVISDSANESADQSFVDFINTYNNSSFSLIEILLNNLKTFPI